MPGSGECHFCAGGTRCADAIEPCARWIWDWWIFGNDVGGLCCCCCCIWWACEAGMHSRREGEWCRWPCCCISYSSFASWSWWSLSLGPEMETAELVSARRRALAEQVPKHSEVAAAAIASSSSRLFGLQLVVFQCVRRPDALMYFLSQPWHT